MSDEKTNSRRDFMKTTLGACAACLACGSLGNVLAACGDGTYNFKQLGAPVTINLSDYPALSNNGGMVSLTRSVTGFRFPIYVRNDGGVYLAMSGECAHEACAVTPRSGGFVCPCHNARFDETGRLLSGPASEGLMTFPVSVSGGQMTIG